MDGRHNGGHVAVGDVHDDGVVEKSEAPGPLVARFRAQRDAGGEIDEQSGDQKEREIEKR